MLQYKYEHLHDDRSIRLLSLLPGHDPTDPIRCQLQVHSLTKDGQIPQYTALSYVWGDRNTDLRIECEGGILSVTRSCFQALRRIRDLLCDSNRDLPFSPHLWIDAICINQSNEQEKAAQIRLMKDIYSSAETVLCFVEDFYNHEGLENTSAPRRQRINQNPPAPFNWMIDRNILSADVNQREPALQRLSKSKYWTRLWTFQEALLSHRKIIFSGTDMIEWESVGTLLQEAAAVRYSGFKRFLPKAIHFHTLTTTSPMLHLLLEGRRTVVAEKLDKTFTRSLSLEISRILSFSSELKTSDPRDKVYALAGLMAALDTEIKIDYSRSMALIHADSISTFSKNSWSFGKWAIRSKGVSYAFLAMEFDSSFDRVHPKALNSKIPTEEGEHMNQWAEWKAEQTMHWSRPGECSTPMIDVSTPSISTSTALDKGVHLVQQENTDWSEEDDYTVSTTSSPSLVEPEDLDYTSFVHSLAHSLLMRSRKWLVSRASAQLGPIMNQCALDEKSGSNQPVSFGANEQTKSQEKLNKGQSNKTQSTRRDRGEDSDDERDQERPKKKKKGNDAVGTEKLLACPFYQRNPQGPPMHRSCTGPGWTSIARLKEHLYRAHFAHRCRRCRTKFETPLELDGHYQDPIPCRASSVTADPMEGFSESQRDSIKCRRMQDWRQIYQILFPDDDKRSIPSEYYSNVIAIANILDQFERHYQQEAERLLPGRLNPILDASPSSPRTALQNDILEMISDIHSTVIRSFRQRMIGMIAENTDPALHGNSSAATPSRIKPSLDNPASFFLEYLNNIDDDDSVSHLQDINLGFDMGDFQSSAVQDQTSGRDCRIHLPQPGSSPGFYDENLSTFTMVENLNVSNVVGVEQETGPTENYDGVWNNDWTLLNNNREASS